MKQKSVLMMIVCILLFCVNQVYAELYDFETGVVPDNFIVKNSEYEGLVGASTNLPYDGIYSFEISRLKSKLSIPLNGSNGHISWWQYDAYGSNSPIYMCAYLEAENSGFLAMLLDSGWGGAASGTINYWKDGIQKYGPNRIAGSWIKIDLNVYNNELKFYVNNVLVDTTNINSNLKSLQFWTDGYNAGSFWIDSVSIDLAQVNGSCGAATGRITATAPTAKLCSSGNVVSMTEGNVWNWNCNGLNGGINTSCSAPKEGIFVNFDNLNPMSSMSGNIIPDVSKLNDQLLSESFVSFHSGADYVAVVNSGLGNTASGSNGIGGATPSGILTYDKLNPIVIKFHDPLNTSNPGITNYVSIRGDLSPAIGKTVILEAYDINDSMLASVPFYDDYINAYVVNVPNIHYIRFIGLTDNEGVALDDLTFIKPVGLDSSVFDVKKPVVDAFSIAATASNLTITVPTFSATDNVAITGYLLTETANAPLADTGGWSAIPPTTYTFSSGGQKTLYAWTKDAAGNVSDPVSAQITLNVLTSPGIWQSLGLAAEDIVSIAIDPTNDQIIYVGTRTNGVFKTMDGGSSWSAINSGMWDSYGSGSMAQALAIDPANSKTIYAGTSMGLFKSTNGGASWLWAWTIAWNNATQIQSLVIDPSNSQTIYAGRNSYGVSKSTDGGATWSTYNYGMADNYPTVQGLVIDPSNSQVLYAATLTGVYKSMDGGVSWAYVSYGMGNTMITSIVIDPNNSQVLYASANYGLLYKSTDGGASWMSANNGLWYTVQTLAIDPTRSQTIYAGTFSSGVFLSTNGGVSWELFNNGVTSTDAKALVVNGQTVYVGTSGGIFRAFSITPPMITLFSLPANATSLSVPVSSFVANDNFAVTGYLLSESPSVPSASAPAWSAVVPTSYLFSNIPDGLPTSRTLYAWAKDAVGNISTGANATVIITLPDVTKPVVNTFSLPSTATSATVSVSTLSATDNVAVTGYLLTESAAAPAPGASGWSASLPPSYTFSGLSDGIATTRTLYAWVRDAAGNISNGASATVTITLPDITKPVISTFAVTATGTTATVEIAALTATDNVAVSGYLVTETATVPAAGALGWSKVAPVSFTFATIPDGVANQKALYAWAKDAAGNISASATATVTITLPDVTKPVVVDFILQTESAMATVTINTITVTDNVGITGYLLSETVATPLATDIRWTSTKPANYTFDGIPDGITTLKTLSLWAKDAASNVSNSKSATVTIILPDISAPVVTEFTVPTQVNKLTVSNISLSASDNVGIAGYLLSESASKPSAASSNWNATVPITYTFTSAGSKTLYAYAKDAVGNVSAAASAILTIDIDPPVMTVSTLASGAITNKGTLNISGKVTDNYGLNNLLINSVTISVNTDGSFSHAVTLVPGSNTVTIIAKDQAGNTATDLRTITLDQASPLLTITTPADNSKTAKVLTTVSGTVDETSTVTITSVINGTQTATMSGKNYSATVTLNQGLNTITLTATDLAGNITNGKRTVIYDPLKPTITVTSPISDTTIHDGIITISGGVEDNISGVADIIVTADGKEYHPKNNSGSFSQQLTFIDEKLYPVTVTVLDNAGNSDFVTRNIILVKGTIVINGGALYTVTPKVTLSLGYYPEAAQMQLNYTPKGWGKIEPFTATKLISLPKGDGLKTLMVRYFDSAGTNLGEYTASITMDTVMPGGVVKINGGALYTNDRNVIVETTATDITSGLSQFCIREDKLHCAEGDFVPFVATTAYPLASPADGKKTVYVSLRDLAGKTSKPLKASIILDTTIPAGSIVINGDKLFTATPLVALKLKADKAAEMKLSLDGGITWGGWDKFASSKKVTLPGGAGKKSVKVRFRDSAGNESAEYEDTITLQ